MSSVSSVSSVSRHRKRFRTVLFVVVALVASVFVALPTASAAGPHAPNNLQALQITRDFVQLSWEAPNSPVVGYDVWQDGRWIGYTTDLGFDIPDLEPATTYTFGVRGIIGGGSASEFVEIEVTTEGDDSFAQPVFRFSQPTLEISESAGQASVFVETGVFPGEEFRPGGHQVSVATQAGSATAGRDFYGLYQVLEVRDWEDRFLTFDIVDDDIAEPNETFRVRLFNPTNGAEVGAERFLTITIVDDDRDASEGVVNVSTETSVDEGAGTARVWVGVENPPAAGFEVKFSTSAGSARAGQDFYGTFQTVRFGPGEAGKFVEVTVVDDTQREAVESFTVRIWDATNGVALGQRNGTVTIYDNE